ncbi:MAG: hypothetical protein HY800_04425 [Ignavibacteriales bacterium]|nr:hypothetical protein [Ignavibacteriales bacterium]
MWRIIIWSIVLLQSCYAGFERTELGVRPFSLGSAYTGLADDIWAISYNTAGLSQLTSYQVSFYYSPQPFGLTELSTASAAAAIPLRFGVIGFSLRKFGFELYREYSGIVSYARSIAGVHLGVNLNYHSVHIDNYGSDAALGVDLGVLVKSFDRISWGVFLKNINSPTIGSTREKLPQTFTIVSKQRLYVAAG